MMGSTEGRCRRGRVYERGIAMEFEVSIVSTFYGEGVFIKRTFVWLRTGVDHNIL